MSCNAQEGGNLVLRQSGQLPSGGSVHIYSADMRRQVRGHCPAACCLRSRCC